ncbi:ATP-binding protein [Acidovorax sp. BL-A-41-H1]|uniref:hybrid sensor histidine kinase/response regulator n=1 Tax=Acidovorax sp. BL-A-41-H1 TaxID=3421102 RepID=UPI003F7998C3
MVQKSSDRLLEILHLEDSEADHGLTTLALKRGGLTFSALRVDTLEEFQQQIDRRCFDIVLADYRLPGFTALDAWSYVAQKPQSPPFILVSGAIGETAAVDAIRMGMADYLLKDDLQRLPHVVERAIEVHEARYAREQAVRELAVSERRLAELAEHLQLSIERERTSIAREIHDDIGGALTAVRFDVAWIARHSDDEAMRKHADSAAEMLHHAIGASQRIMMNLRPPVLEQGLVAAVQWLATGFEQRTGTPVQLTKSRDTIPASSDIQLVAYRTAQEALTNISKHAAPSKVTIDLSDQEGVLTIEVSDDGVGIEPEMLSKPRTFGLRGLQERARTVGGWIDISSRPGKGTSVILSVPLTAAGSSVAQGEHQ